MSFLLDIDCPMNCMAKPVSLGRTMDKLSGQLTSLIEMSGALSSVLGAGWKMTSVFLVFNVYSQTQWLGLK